MQQPERVFAEIFRVLKPGGVCIITYSNRQFYQKARSIDPLCLLRRDIARLLSGKRGLGSTVVVTTAIFLHV
jgi:ubiquinone/menaquinone biosynthesis C-methylase UbiE